MCGVRETLVQSPQIEERVHVGDAPMSEGAPNGQSTSPWGPMDEIGRLNWMTPTSPRPQRS